MGRIRVPRTSQPQDAGGSRIDWGNPLTRGLSNLFIGGSAERDIVRNTQFSHTGAPILEATGKGRFLKYVAGASTSIGGISTGSSQEYTVSFVLRCDSLSHTTYPEILSINGWYGFNCHTQGDGVLYIGTDAVNRLQTGAGYLSVSDGFVYIALTKSPSGQRLYKNGVLTHSNGIDPTMTFGAGTIAPNQSWRGVIDNIAIHNRALLATEIKSLSANPWQIFQPLARNVFSEVAAGGGTHATSGALTGPGASVAGTAAHIAKHATSGALTGQIGSVAGTAARTRAHPSSGALTGQGSAVAGTAARSTPGGSHATSGALTGQGSTIAGTAAHKAKHATSGSLSGQGSLVAGTAARVAAAVTHATSGTLTGPGAIVSGSAQNGAVAPPSVGGSGGTGGSARVRNRKELDDLLTKALKKPTEVAVQLLLPTSPSPEAVAAVISALETRDAETNKSAARQAQSLLARLQVLEREAEDEEAAVIALLLD